MGTPWLVVSARPAESTRTRSSGAAAGFVPGVGRSPVLADAFFSDSVLAPTGSSGSTFWPICGSADALPYSLGFAALNGNASATISVAARCISASSEGGRALRFEGPLTVERDDDLAGPPARAVRGDGRFFGIAIPSREQAAGHEWVLDDATRMPEAGSELLL